VDKNRGKYGPHDKEADLEQERKACALMLADLQEFEREPPTLNYSDYRGARVSPVMNYSGCTSPADACAI
jgi:hypothetical protein